MSGLEKRESQRFEFHGNVRIRILFTPSENLKEVEGKIGNVSAGGLFIETEEEFEEGALADLSFKLPDNLPANTLGLVKWCKPKEGIGLEFFYATEEEKQAIIASLQRTFGTAKKVEE